MSKLMKLNFFVKLTLLANSIKVIHICGILNGCAEFRIISAFD